MVGNSFPWLLEFPLMIHELMQKLKTRVVKDNCNPEWNEELTLSIADTDVPINLVRNLKNVQRMFSFATSFRACLIQTRKTAIELRRILLCR